MSDLEPKRKQEFEDRYHANALTEGEGRHIQVHAPCPCCGAADWLVHGLQTAVAAYHKGATCKECSRTVHAEVDYDERGMSLKLVQTAGPPAPEWVGIRYVAVGAEE